MKYSACISLLVLLAFISCSEDEPALPPTPPPVPKASTAKELLSFSFLAEANDDQLTQDLHYTVQDSLVNLMFPPGLARDSLVASFSTSAATVLVDTVVQYSDSTHNNYTQPITYTLVAEDSSVADYVMRSHTYAEVPVVYVETEDQAPIVSKEDYINAQITIIADGSGTEPISKQSIEIRGRGNTTWQMPKKPYRFRFDERTEVLGMPAHKVWVLLANYPDKTLLRNHTAFEMGRRFGLAYSPRSRFVDLYLNGSYRGNYQLTEQIKIDENRLAIDELELDDLDEDVISGGYLLEIDGRSDPDPAFTTTQGIKFRIKSPDEGPQEQLTYIQDYVQTTEDVLFSDNFADPEQGYARYIDTESFVNWYLINEVAKNTDAKFANSVYLHKPRGGKLTMGPVWDYDIGFGNVDYSAGEFTEGWYIREASWFRRLFEDPTFEQRVKDRWQEIQPELQAVIDQIDQNSASLEQSQRLNFTSWRILDKRVWPNPVQTGSYSGEVAYLKEWLSQRIDWMNSELSR